MKLNNFVKILDTRFGQVLLIADDGPDMTIMFKPDGGVVTLKSWAFPDVKERDEGFEFVNDLVAAELALMVIEEKNKEESNDAIH